VRHTIWVVCLVAAIAAADEFTNKKTTEAIEGKLLGKVTLEGKTFLLVKTADGMKRLPVDEWFQTASSPKVTQPEPKAGTKTAGEPKSKPAVVWKSTEYRGKVRTTGWMSKAFGAAAQQVLSHGERYYNACDVRPLGKGKVGRGGKAIRVLNNGRVLATLANGQRVAVEGLTLTGVIGGQRWTAYLIGVKTYEDKDASGDARHVLRCERLVKVGRGLTRGEFLKMLEAGVRLYSRETCPRCKGKGYVMRESSAVAGMQFKRDCKMCRGKKALLVDLADGKPKR